MHRVGKIIWAVFLFLVWMPLGICVGAELGPNRPQIPSRTFTITDFGAVADGKTFATEAVTRTIHACTAAGGGSVVVPAGKYLVGPFVLASNLDLHLEKDAVLLITDDPSKFETQGNRYQNCITADGCHDIAITGAGTIDGQGAKWWAAFLKEKESAAGPAHRPFMVVLNNCTRVLVQGVTLTNSPMFHLVPRDCHDVVIDGIHIIAPAKAPNTDGIDPSGWNFLITHCIFDVGDDCIAVKATGKAEEGHLSCEDFLITQCTFNHGHGMSIGGQTNGGLRRMTVSDCTFESTDAGIRLKAGRGAGGLVEDLLYENLKMNNVKMPIVITSYYPGHGDNAEKDPAQPMKPTTPIWRNIKINNVTATHSQSAGQILGLAESPVVDVVMTHVHISADKGMRIVHAKGIRLIDSSISVENAPAIQKSDAGVSGVDLDTGR